MRKSTHEKSDIYERAECGKFDATTDMSLLSYFCESKILHVTEKQIIFRSIRLLHESSKHERIAHSLSLLISVECAHTLLLSSRQTVCALLYLSEINKNNDIFKIENNKKSLLQLDSATSLIQAAKNLMNAVVLTVKYSYVASTKYTRQGVVSVSSIFKNIENILVNQHHSRFF